MSDTTNLQGKQSRITKKVGRIKAGLVPMTGNRTVGSQGLYHLGTRSLFWEFAVSPDRVIKSTHSSKEAAEPTEPSACPDDWVFLGKSIA